MVNKVENISIEIVQYEYRSKNNLKKRENMTSVTTGTILRGN